LEAGVYFVRVANAFDTYCEITRRNAGLGFEDAPHNVTAATAMLQALMHNDTPFENADGLQAAAAKSLQQLVKPWDEELPPMRSRLLGRLWLTLTSTWLYALVCLS
jgi:hypothetical protein